MRFEESWYLLGLVGFRKLKRSYIWWDYPAGVELPVGSDGEQLTSRFQHARSRNHQLNSDAGIHIEMLFSDIYEVETGRKTEDCTLYHVPRNVRKRNIEITCEKRCQRCGGTDRLEREHIIPLSKGGKDESGNLRYLCYVCHKFHHAEQDILYGIKQSKEKGKPVWHLRMWEYRLKILRDLNPVGQTHYVSYWSDPQTHYEKWYRKLKVKPSLENNRIEAFFEASVSATGFDSAELKKNLV